MKKETTREGRDIYIGTCYLNLSTPVETDKKITKLTEEIVNFQQKVDEMFMGNLNAET